ncbi:MAG: DUF3326 domain-containing protein [Candidatus Gastranaerophilales bacterium]|nr:DUF3326 domain-containing protein [Candidatus Gastranaerophilales bacterium]
MDKLAFIVPTGIGASIGGYAGDAGAYARKLSEKYTLIVNPNVVNAACFSAINDNMLYVEGYALDLFFKEQITLRPSKKNKIGVIFDKAIPESILNIHINTLNAMKMVYGIETIYEITDEPVGVEFKQNLSGISTGNINMPETLYKSAQKLIDNGCNALAPVCLFEDCDDDEDYANAKGVDIVGGVEAVISHLLTKKFLLPTAHAPAFKNVEISSEIISPKAAAEYITPTFLPCIILGLYNAPTLIPFEEKEENDICARDLNGVLMPYNSLGSTPVFKSLELNIPVFAIKENQTVLNVTKEKLKTDKITEIDTFEDFAL